MNPAIRAPQKQVNVKTPRGGNLRGVADCEGVDVNNPTNYAHASRADLLNLLAVRDQMIELLDAENKALHDELAKRPAAKKPPAPRTDNGVIYYLRIAGRYKIGWTARLDNRMKGYAPDAELLAVHPGTRADERHLHKKFAHLTSHGNEWYPLANQIRDHIDTMVKLHGTPPDVTFAAKPTVTPMPHRRIGGPKPKSSVQHRA